MDYGSSTKRTTKAETCAQGVQIRRLQRRREKPEARVAKPEDVGPIIQITQSILGASAMQVINAMRVGGVQQVQLDVTVASVNRTEARRRGCMRLETLVASPGRPC